VIDKVIEDSQATANKLHVLQMNDIQNICSLMLYLFMYLIYTAFTVIKSIGLGGMIF
jgi:hypothetical protein